MTDRIEIFVEINQEIITAIQIPAADTNDPHGYSI